MCVTTFLDHVHFPSIFSSASALTCTALLSINFKKGTYVDVTWKIGTNKKMEEKINGSERSSNWKKKLAIDQRVNKAGTIASRKIEH